MIDISKMTMSELINFTRAANEKDILELIDNKEYLLKLDLVKLNVFYLNLNDKYKKILLNDLEIFDKIMSIPPNRMKKTILELSSNDVRQFIYNHKNLKNSKKGQELLNIHLHKLSNEELTLLLHNDNLKNIYQVDIIDYIDKFFRTDEYLKMLVSNSVATNSFNHLALFKIKNEIELLIYTKFNILVDFEKNIQGIDIGYDFLKNVNKKHITSLIDLLKNKEEITDNNMLFISVIKLYTIFGLDNSKKILNDFFTFATKASLKRVSNELFKENRREFRLKNQKKFYYHNIEIDFLNALTNNDLDFFRNFCLDTSDTYINNLIDKSKEELFCLSDLEKLNKIKEIIDKEIQKREAHYRDLDTNKFYKYYEEMSRNNKITLTEIYNIFAPTNVKCKLNKEGKIIINTELNEFLLGNYKKDNDCLLRMVLNKHAFGLNRELYNIINNFDKIKEVIEKNGALSLNSISDVIDISKVLLYNLAPNELDITLETLSKILNSRKYCTEEPEKIIKRALNLHKKRKQKIASVIEPVKGVCNNTKYKTANFYNEDLLVCGIDTGSCFKIGGKGEEFFEYCLTSPKGVVFYLEYNNTKYVLPATINGNMLNINSIDPIIEDEVTFNEIFNAIKQLSKEIIENENNKLEIATMTDIHLNKFLDNANYEPIYFKKFLPLNTDYYSDYNKKDVTNYVIYKKYYNSKEKYTNNYNLFYQKRSVPYIISPNHEYDKERITIMINSIAYSSIDYLNISFKEKNKEKEYYSNKNIDDYHRIVGNIDWYIGIKKDGTIEEYLLPYDERAKEEYNKCLEKLTEVLKDNNIKKK